MKSLRTSVLAAFSCGMVLCSFALAQKIECEYVDVPGKRSTVLMALYPPVGGSEYRVEVYEVDSSKRPAKTTSYQVFEATGKVDRRFMEGKLELRKPGTVDVLGEVEWVHPPDLDPSDYAPGAKVPGIVRELRMVGGGVVQFQYCSQEPFLAFAPY